MPKGTKVDDIYEALKAKGYDSGKAARIAQSKSGESLKTGEPPAKKAADLGYPQLINQMGPQGSNRPSLLGQIVARLVSEGRPFGNVLGNPKLLGGHYRQHLTSTVQAAHPTEPPGWAESYADQTASSDLSNLEKGDYPGPRFLDYLNKNTTIEEAPLRKAAGPGPYDNMGDLEKILAAHSENYHNPDYYGILADAMEARGHPHAHLLRDTTGSKIGPAYHAWLSEREPEAINPEFNDPKYSGETWRHIMDGSAEMKNQGYRHGVSMQLRRIAFLKQMVEQPHTIQGGLGESRQPKAVPGEVIQKAANLDDWHKYELHDEPGVVEESYHKDTPVRPESNEPKKNDHWLVRVYRRLTDHQPHEV